MKKNILDKITIIIPSYYLHHYLKRTLDYIQGSGIKIIVVDSTDIVFKEREKYDIEYHHFPNMLYSEKLYFAAQKVTTDYVLLCTHDDIVVLEGLADNIEFLESNQDYVVSKGVNLFFNTRYDSFNVISYNDYSDKSVVSDSPQARLQQHFNNYTHLVYSVVRKDIFEKLFEYSAKYQIKDLAVLELLQCGIYLISGKLNNFSSMCYMQENLEKSAGNIFTSYSITKDNKRDHENVKLILVEYLHSKSDISTQASIEYIDQILNGFLEKIQDSFFAKIKKAIRRNIPNSFLKFKHVRHYRETEKIVYKNLSDEDKKQFNEIRNFILTQGKN